MKAILGTLIWGVIASVPAFALDIPKLLLENRLEEGKEACLPKVSSKFLDKKSAFACAWIFLRNEDPGNAERVFEQLKPYSTSDEYRMLVAYKYAVRKNFDESENLLKEIRSEKKGSGAGTRAELLRAEVVEKRGGIETAAFLYKQLQNEAPNDPRLNWALGRWHLSRGEMERAMEFMEKVTVAWPLHVASRFNLALIHMAKGKDGVKNAAKYLSECYQINRKDAEVLEQLGNVFEIAQKPQQAIKYWQLALELNPKSASLRKKVDENYGALIDHLIDEKKFNEALLKLNALSQTVRGQPEYELKNAIILKNLGRFQQAAHKFDAVIKQRPDEVLAIRELGICYLNLKRWDEAKKYFAKAISLEPGNGMNYAWLAFVLEGKHELSAAVEMWEKALSLLRDTKEIAKGEEKLKSLKARLKRSNERTREED